MSSLERAGNLSRSRPARDDPHLFGLCQTIDASSAMTTPRREPGPPCQYCGVPLATDRAKQCIDCGYDWRDPANVVCRRKPGWNRLGLNLDAVYVLELCQMPTGERYTKFREDSSGVRDPHCIFETQSALGRQFVEWKFGSEWCKHLSLSCGMGFWFEPHGIWLTDAEARYLKNGRRGEPPWPEGIAPLLPPA